ncbi:hypothetical protein Lepto7376_0832 [[Leptolyngbya] sp. PCC 7376]|uniref:helix-turn-helix domain-containing protein n=1 Tax=[Leptolyngbya] sp. PCC 7376 TaxID=111781 RepID=UPI00029F407A|nr:helix-turn-helix domain-containing protein [[Leptolyngbya] sp. PCC 7376]AFY37227.1 hypothetical protein Lepto7376_0832 [[Leptolyngbya] sp. PCC 7376]
MKEITSDILTQQQERLIEIGSQLQAARLEQKRTLNFVARQTKIRATLLRHLEAAELQRLPEPIYVRSLIQRYAECLGLDSRAIAAQFPVDEKPHGWQLPFWKRLTLQFHLRPVHLYVVYLVVIVTTVQSLANNLKTPRLSLDPQLETATEVSEIKQPQAAPKPQASESIDPMTALVDSLPESTIADASEIVIDIEAQENAWMRVEVDGKTEFEGTLPKGTQKQWVVDESIKIRTGNAGAVMITINDETPHPLGEPGAVEEFTYQALADDAERIERANS